METAITIGLSLLFAYLLAAGFFLMLAAAELAFPKEQHASKARRFKSGWLFALYLPFTYLGFAAISLTVGPIKPLFQTASVLGSVGAAVLAVVSMDFFYYWLHRAEHRIPILWRFHSVHHSIERMSQPAGYHHPTDPILIAIFCVLPTVALVSAPSIVLIGALHTFHQYYLHSGTALNFGPLSAIIADNRTHRIHHSTDERHQNRNFAASFFLWDRLFGTAYKPGTEWPAIGLSHQPEPETLRDYLLANKPVLDRGSNK